MDVQASKLGRLSRHPATALVKGERVGMMPSSFVLRPDLQTDENEECQNER